MVPERSTLVALFVAVFFPLAAAPMAASDGARSAASAGPRGTGTSNGALAAPAPVTPAGAPSGAAALSPRKALKQARAAFEAGRAGEAQNLYEKVLVQTPEHGTRREEALYRVGVLRLSQDPALRDIDRARTTLGELIAGYPSSEDRLAAQSMVSLTDEILAGRRETESLKTRVASAEKSLAEEHTKLLETQGELAEVSARHNEEMASLKKDMLALKGEMASLRTEIQQKDDALQKMKKALVSPKPR